MGGDLIFLLVGHPNQPLPISVKVESGVKLTNDFIVPIILEAHHGGQLQVVTSLLYVIKVLVLLVLHPLPVDPFGLIHRLELGEVD
jgi:hypothetical protein